VVGRYRRGDRQLLDRSSAPRRVANRTDPERVAVIVRLRRLRMTAAEVAETLAMPLSTVSGILSRVGMGRLGRIGLEQGKLRDVHGWEFVHVAVDDYSRLAYAEVLDDETAKTAVGFLRRAVASYGRYGISVERVITDNGSCYRAALHALACRLLGIKHLRTRPSRPQTNGEAERFIRSLLAGWAHGPIYGSSHERTTALDGWLWHYNHRRRHAALGHQPPATRTNVLGSYN
jgi:transposase InsO family protein